MSFEQIKDNFLNVVLNHYADFNGRARRSEYWYFTLVNVCISLVLSLLQQITGWNLFSVLSGLVSLALLVPGLGLAWPGDDCMTSASRAPGILSSLPPLWE